MKYLLKILNGVCVTGIPMMKLSVIEKKKDWCENNVYFDIKTFLYAQKYFVKFTTSHSVSLPNQQVNTVHSIFSSVANVAEANLNNAYLLFLLYSL